MRLLPVLIAVLCAALVAAAPVVSAPASPTRPRPLLVGAAEDAAKSGRSAPTRRWRWRARPASTRSASPRSGDPARPQSPATSWRPPDGGRRGDGERDPPDRLGLSVRIGHDARYATTRAQFAAYAASIPRLVPSIRYLIVGNEPNLNRFWMPQFTKRGLDAAASSYLGLLAQTYDAIKAVAPGTIVIGGSLCASRQRQPPLVPADPLPDALHPRPGHRVSAERPQTPGDGLVRDPPVPRARAHPADLRAPAVDGDLARRLRQAASGSWAGHSTARASGLDAADDLRRVRRADEAARRQASHVCEPEPPSAVDAVDETTQGRYYRAGAPAGRVPAKRGRAPLLPRHPTRPSSTAGSPGCTTPTTPRSRISRSCGPQPGPRARDRWSRPAASLAFSAAG